MTELLMQGKRKWSADDYTSTPMDTDETLVIYSQPETVDMETDNSPMTLIETMDISQTDPPCIEF